MRFASGTFKNRNSGTVRRKTIKWDILDEQEGDATPVPFSFTTKEIPQPQIKCYITNTNEKTHQIIRDNFSKCALFSGLITGVGPRYCPSIEDKLVKFADRTSHQIFWNLKDIIQMLSIRMVFPHPCRQMFRKNLSIL